MDKRFTAEEVAMMQQCFCSKLDVIIHLGHKCIGDAEGVGFGPIPNDPTHQAEVYRDKDGTFFYIPVNFPTHCSG